MSPVMTILDRSVARSLAEELRPCASVYVGLDGAEPGTDAAEDLGLRWRRLATRLAAQGADEASNAAIGRHLAQLPVSPARYAVFASDGVVRFGQSLPGPDQMDLARFGAPANVIPLLAWLQSHPPYVVVVTDRTGADLTTVPSGAASGSTSTVVGPDDEIERNAPGGWAQARYQRRAEDSWQHNANVVAKAVTDALHQVGARLLLVAGDVRAVQLLREGLPAEVHRGTVIRKLPGGRTPDRYGDRQAAIEAAVTEYVAQQTAQLLEELDTERRPGGPAVEGVAATLAALAEGRVRTLLVADDSDDERVAWFGPDVLCAQLRPAEAISWTAQGRLVDIAVRAALLTDAEVRVVASPQAGAVAERIGALCRFTPTPPPTP